MPTTELTEREFTRVIRVRQVEELEQQARERTKTERQLNEFTPNVIAGIVKLPQDNQVSLEDLRQIFICMSLFSNLPFKHSDDIHVPRDYQYEPAQGYRVEDPPVHPISYQVRETISSRQFKIIAKELLDIRWVDKEVKSTLCTKIVAKMADHMRETLQKLKADWGTEPKMPLLHRPDDTIMSTAWELSEKECANTTYCRATTIHCLDAIQIFLGNEETISLAKMILQTAKLKSSPAFYKELLESVKNWVDETLLKLNAKRPITQGMRAFVDHLLCEHKETFNDNQLNERYWWLVYTQQVQQVQAYANLDSYNKWFKDQFNLLSASDLETKVRSLLTNTPPKLHPGLWRWMIDKWPPANVGLLCKLLVTARITDKDLQIELRDVSSNEAVRHTVLFAMGEADIKQMSDLTLQSYLSELVDNRFLLTWAYTRVKDSDDPRGLTYLIEAMQEKGKSMDDFWELNDTAKKIAAYFQEFPAKSHIKLPDVIAHVLDDIVKLVSAGKESQADGQHSINSRQFFLERKDKQWKLPYKLMLPLMIFPTSTVPTDVEIENQLLKTLMIDLKIISLRDTEMAEDKSDDFKKYYENMLTILDSNFDFIINKLTDDERLDLLKFLTTCCTQGLTDKKSQQELSSLCSKLSSFYKNVQNKFPDEELEQFNKLTRGTLFTKKNWCSVM